MLQVVPLSHRLYTYTDFSHMSVMFDGTKMTSGLYHFFHFALLNECESFVFWIRIKLHDSTHFSTAFPSSSVVVYPHVVLWLLKSPITM